MTILQTVDTASMEWENGLDVVRRMAPAFRENLGPRHLVEDLFTKYNQKSLLLDETTTQRIDLISVEGGYRDLTHCYHDSVEECLVLEGSLHIDGEDDFTEGDYFWRPPGFVHAASTEVGFVALLLFEGYDEAEASGRVSRHIEPAENGGTNQLTPNLEEAVGPRGWVRRQPTSLLPWIPGPIWSERRRGQFSSWDLNRTMVKVLSENEASEGRSFLIRLQPGFAADFASISTPLALFVIDGGLSMGEDQLEPGTFARCLHDASLPLVSDRGATIFVKSKGLVEPLRSHIING